VDDIRRPLDKKRLDIHRRGLYGVQILNQLERAGRLSILIAVTGCQEHLMGGLLVFNQASEVMVGTAAATDPAGDMENSQRKAVYSQSSALRSNRDAAPPRARGFTLRNCDSNVSAFRAKNLVESNLFRGVEYEQGRFVG
jgi:hypothetical protein